MATHDEQFERADRIFEAALDLPPAERPAYLEAECGGDPELRELIERLLLHSEDEPTRWLPPGGAIRSPLGEELLAEAGDGDGDGDGRGEGDGGGAPVEELIGRYRLVREIGRGGMAVVYLAERADGQFQQQVALKRIRHGTDTEEVIRRFEQERQILALQRHPNVARLIDGGVGPDGHPYFVMEHVEGQPIDRYCDERRLPLRERLRLVLEVARALEYAHRNLVVHRDVKPSNILVSADGHVKLLDFGIAKLIGAEPGTGLHTRTDALVMTPLYASPEQVRGEPVTTASDVYQLGLLLYVLLTGRWPYRTSGGRPVEMVMAICNDEPTRPSTAAALAGRPVPPAAEAPPPESIAERRATTPRRLRRALAGDLDRILLKALRKEPERRYGSVAQLISDLEGYLAGRPVSARPDTFLYRAGKLVRRHRAAFATAAGAAVLLFGLALFYTLELARERDRARLLAAEAGQVSEFLVELFEVSAPTRSKGEKVTARQLLDRGARRIETELAGQPALQAAMMTLVGNVYRELALYDEARAQLERAVELRRRHPGPAGLELAESLHGLARVLEESGGPDAAGRLYTEALELRRAALGPEDPEVARTLAGLGRVLGLRGEYESARAYLERSLEIFEARGEGEESEAGLTLVSLGEVLREMRERTLARVAFERAVAILERRHEPDHPHVARARVDLARVLHVAGDAEAARRTYESALPQLERAYGGDHPQVAEALGNFAHLLLGIGDPSAAVATYRRAIAIREQTLGPRHPLVAESLNHLGIAQWRLQDRTAALDSFERSAAIYEAAFGPDHVDLARPLRNLGELLHELGEGEHAIPIFRRVIELREAAYGPDHSFLAAPLYKLGRVYLSQGDPETAEPLLRRALSLGRAEGLSLHPEVIWPRIDLARCLAQLGRPAEARELLEANLAEAEIDEYSKSYTLERLAELDRSASEGSVSGSEGGRG